MASERKIVTITGESRGFCARMLNARGEANYRVFGTCRCIGGGDHLLVITGEGDNSCLDTPERLIRLGMVGVERTDTLVNAAVAGRSTKHTETDFARTALNLDRFSHLTQHPATRSLQAQCGRIFNKIAAIARRSIRLLASRSANLAPNRRGDALTMGGGALISELASRRLLKMQLRFVILEQLEVRRTGKSLQESALDHDRRQ